MGTHGEPLAQNSALLCMVLSLLCMRVVLDARASYRSQSHVCHRARLPVRASRCVCMLSLHICELVHDITSISHVN